MRDAFFALAEERRGRCPKGPWIGNYIGELLMNVFLIGCGGSARI